MAKPELGRPPQMSQQHMVITDSTTAKTYSVVKGKIPKDLAEGLERDFTAEETEHIYARVNKTLAPPVDGQPQCLWVFGPSAVGKSYLGNAKASDLFGCVQNGVVIDGSEFREQHAGWQAVAMHGHEHGLLHADAWSIYKEAGKACGDRGDGIKGGWSGQLKKRLLREAMRDRQHMMIPDCANHPDRLQKMLEEVKEAGYGMHAICLWAPLTVTRRRGEERAVREGKIWSPKEYAKCVRGSVVLAMRWIDGMRDEPSVYKSLELWDNTHFPACECGLEEFAALTAMTEEESALHAMHVKNSLKTRHEKKVAKQEEQMAALRGKGFVAMGTSLGTSTGDVVALLHSSSQSSLAPAPATNGGTAGAPAGVPSDMEAVLPCSGRTSERWRGRWEGSLLGTLAGLLLGAGITAAIAVAAAGASS